METTLLPNFLGILTSAGKTLKRYRKELVVIAIFFRCINMVFNYFMGAAFIDNSAFSRLQMGITSTDELNQVLSMIWAYAPSLILLGIVFVVLMIVGQILTIKYALAHDNVENTEFGHFLQDAFKKVLPFIGTNIIQTIFLIGLFILLVIPWIIFSIFRIFTTAVVIDQGKYYTNALKESKQIVKGRRWKTVGHLLLILLCVIVVSAILTALLSFIGKLSGSDQVIYGLTSLGDAFIQVIAQVLVISMYILRNRTRVITREVPAYQTEIQQGQQQ